MKPVYFLFLYLICINLCGFAAMAIDKNKAVRGAWRIREKTLFLLAALGGSLGSISGMYLFRHKTRHTLFVVGMPAILLIQITAALWILLY